MNIFPKKQAVVYFVNINAESWTSGVYLVKLKFGEFGSSYRKIICLK